MNDKPKLTRFLKVDLTLVAYTAGAGLAGGFAAGLFARLAMRAVALLAGLEPEFSISGTIGILVIFGIAGVLFGWLYAVISHYLPWPPVLGGGLYGVLLMSLAAIPLFGTDLEGELALLSPQSILAVFAPVFLSYGIILGLVTRRLTPRLAAAPSRPRGVLSLAIFVILTILSLMSLPTLGEFSLPFPQAISRLYIAAGLSYNATHNLRNLLVLGFGLLYVGTSVLIYWRRERSWMAKFTVFSLLAFAAAFFNSRDVIAAAFLGLPQAPVLSRSLRTIGYIVFLLLLYLFPDGRFTPRWSRPLAILFSIWGAAWFLELAPASPLSPASWPHALQLGVFFGSLGTGVLAQVLRYRQDMATGRATGWIVLSFLLAVGGVAAIWLATLINPGLGASGSPRLPLTSVFAFAPYLVPWALIPISIALAIFREDLWAEKTLMHDSRSA